MTQDYEIDDESADEHPPIGIDHPTTGDITYESNRTDVTYADSAAHMTVNVSTNDVDELLEE